MADFVNAVNIIQSIVHHLNTVNIDDMVRKAIAVPVQNERQLDEIASLIHERALNRPKFVKSYAKLCAELVNDGFNGQAGSGSAFREVLLPKCQDAFEETCKISTATTDILFLSESFFVCNDLTLYKVGYFVNNTPTECYFWSSLDYLIGDSIRIETATDCKLSNRKTTYYVANCELIGELFNLDVIPKETAWSYLNKLMTVMSGNLQIQCQCALLQSAAPKLSKSYSMTRAVGQLLVLGNNTLRNEDLPPLLTNLIGDIKSMYLMYWVHELPDELAMKCLYDDDTLESFNYNSMSECIYDECWDLLFIYAYDEVSDESNDVERFLTPVLNSLLRHNRASFIVSFILAALGVEDDNIRTYAGRLLAALVKAERLSKFEVVSRFDQILHDEDTNAACVHIPDLINSIRNEFEDILN